ncbi:hypothetical protein IWX90DRAFT_290607 [Phyllosticta citrichinensis]|uniref:Uncharacterized protein n=1 Tax=Phyllosticta citrichinensis TaxID=1130410 RepID=A0ABR1XPK0_9PEZI
MRHSRPAKHALERLSLMLLRRPSRFGPLSDLLKAGTLSLKAKLWPRSFHCAFWWNSSSVENSAFSKRFPTAEAPLGPSPVPSSAACMSYKDGSWAGPWCCIIRRHHPINNHAPLQARYTLQACRESLCSPVRQRSGSEPVDRPMDHSSMPVYSHCRTSEAGVPFISLLVKVWRPQWRFCWHHADRAAQTAHCEEEARKSNCVDETPVLSACVEHWPLMLLPSLKSPALAMKNHRAQVQTSAWAEQDCILS